MKKLPPPNNGKLTKKSNGSGALVTEDYFKRFEHLLWIYDQQVEAYSEELSSANSSRAVRRLLDTLSPMSDEERGDSLEKLWPNEDIHCPSRAFYVQRLGLLVGSFPSASPHSPKVYTGMLVSRVAVKEPSCMVLESAVNELVDTYKYSNAPNIADLMSLLDKHEKLWEKRLEIHNEIQSGRARKLAERRLAYEEEYEQRKVDGAIADLEKLNQPEMIAELREHGIDALDEEFADKIRVLKNEALERARIAEQERREKDPKYKAIVAFLKQFKLYEWHYDELVETLYKEASAEVIEATIANNKGLIPPDALRNINEGLADKNNNYMSTYDFIKKATFKTLHLHQEKPKKAVCLRWDDDEPRQGKRIVF